MIDQYIEKYGRRLYGLCLTLCTDRCEADDLYQETWLKAYKNIRQYDTDRPFEGWITSICVNAYRDSLRKKKLFKIFDYFTTSEEKDESIASVAQKEKDDYSDLHNAVNRLPDKLRMAVILFYFHDMKLQDVAKSLDIPVGTVKSRLNQARKLLRKELSDEQDIRF